MGIVAIFVKLPKVCMQDSWDFYITIFELHPSLLNCSFHLLIWIYVGCSSVGVVNVILGYFVTTIYVMGGLEVRKTYDVQIWSINAKENEVETV